MVSPMVIFFDLSAGPNYKEAVLELNASNERGIDVVRNKIKMFAQQKVTLPKGRQKIIILTYKWNTCTCGNT